MSGFDWGYSGVGSDDWAEEDGDLAAPIEPAEPPQGHFGRYRIEGELGRGGMGVVYRAFDPDLGRDVALKVVLQKNLPERRKKRFEREGELTARLTHPGIVGVHSAGEIDGLLYLAYELVEGCQTLTEAFADRTLEERAALVRDAARALGFAHRQGVVHRDVKPENLLVDAAGAVRVADFGLAAASGLERLTQSGAVVGTPTHMAPEQLQPEREAVGPHSDVWGLGVTLYRALTGALPFDGKTLLGLGAQIIDAHPRPPHELAPRVPPALELVCLKALAPFGAERYADGEAMAADLERALRGESVVASRGSTLAQLRGLVRRSRGVRLSAAVLLVVGSAAGSVYLANRSLSSTVATSIAQNELHLRARKLDQATRQALLSGSSLQEDGAVLAVLQKELGLLASQAGAEAETREQLLLCERRLDALAALAALEEGRAGPAQAWLAGSSSDDPALRGGVAGALRAAGARGPEDARAALAELERGMTAVARPELRGWRALARVLSGGLDRVTARESLEDLLALRRVREGLSPRFARLEVQLHLELGQVPQAAAALEGLGGGAQELAQAVLFARASLALDEGREGSAFELLSGGELRSGVAAREREQLAARCQADAERLAATEPLQPRRLITLLRILRVLRPDLPLARSLLAPLVDYVVVKNTRSYELGPDIAALAPDDFWVHEELARAGARNESSEVAGPMAAVAERAVELAPDPRARARVQLYLAIMYDELGRRADVLAVCDEALSQLKDPRMRSRAFELRGQARHALGGDLLLALDDFERAGETFAGRQSPLLHDRMQVLVRLGRKEEAFELGLRYMRVVNRESAKFTGTVVTLWGIARELDRPEALAESFELLLERHPDFGGWWLRRAWVDLRAGRVEQAAADLERAAPLLAKHPVFEGHTAPGSLQKAASLAPRVTKLADGLRARGADGLVDLDALIEELDAARGIHVIP